MTSPAPSLRVALLIRTVELLEHLREFPCSARVAEVLAAYSEVRDEALRELEAMRAERAAGDVPVDPDAGVCQ